MRLVHDGVVEREGVEGLARRLGYSSRHLTRVLRAELGAGPLALARAHRAQTARTLLASTELPIADIAFAAGFGSLRQFNDTIAEVYRATPSELRALSRRGRAGVTPEPALPGTLTLKLAARTPLDATGLFRFFADHAVPGLEEGDTHLFARPLSLPGGPAEIEVRADASGATLVGTVRLSRLADIGAAVARIRRAFDLDADAVAIDAALSTDRVLAPLIAATPGIRIAGSFDPSEALIRTLVGQQISVASARTLLGRLVAELGDGATFPSPATIAEHGRGVLRGPTARIDAIIGIAEALADGTLAPDIGMPLTEFRAALLAQRGIGPWTADYLAMRVLGAPDVLPVDDLVIRQSAAALGLPGARGELARYAERWSPWRSYAALHLWRARPPRLRVP